MDQLNMVNSLSMVTPHERMCKGYMLGNHQQQRFKKDNAWREMHK